jgi:hypothetical protein
MALTGGQFRERGILRTIGDVVAKAGDMVAFSMRAMPVGRGWRTLKESSRKPRQSSWQRAWVGPLAVHLSREGCRRRER